MSNPELRAAASCFATCLTEKGPAKPPFLNTNGNLRNGPSSAAAIAAMVDAELSQGDPRSFEYRAGMIDLLRRKLSGEPMPRRYRQGTAQSDAYFSGVDRGWVLYRGQLKRTGDGGR